MNTRQVYYYLRELYEGMILVNMNEGAIEFHYNRIDYRATVDHTAQRVQVEYNFFGKWKPKTSIPFSDVLVSA